MRITYNVTYYYNFFTLVSQLCLPGGEVAFDVKNDAPTLTGAKATFNIDLRFPPNQTVLPDGQVVWARNCTVEGQTFSLFFFSSSRLWTLLLWPCSPIYCCSFVQPFI